MQIKLITKKLQNVAKLATRGIEWNIQQAVTGEDACALIDAANFYFDLVIIDQTLSQDDGSLKVCVCRRISNDVFFFLDLIRFTIFNLI